MNERTFIDWMLPELSSRGSYKASFASIATRSCITLLTMVWLSMVLVGNVPSRFRCTRAVRGWSSESRNSRNARSAGTASNTRWTTRSSTCSSG